MSLTQLLTILLEDRYWPFCDRCNSIQSRRTSTHASGLFCIERAVDVDVLQEVPGAQTSCHPELSQRFG